MSYFYVQKDKSNQRNINHFTDRDVLCIGFPSCNLNCAWCLNKEFFEETRLHITKEDILERMKKEDPFKTIIGFGYGEPLTYGYELLYEISMHAFEHGFQTYITTNGINADMDFVLSHFTYIDLDIKYMPAHRDKIKNYISIHPDKYFSHLNKFLINTYSAYRRINISLLIIPEMWKDFSCNVPYLDYMFKLLQYGSSITLKAFFSRDCDFSTSHESNLIEVEKKIKTTFPNLPFGIYRDINYF